MTRYPLAPLAASLRIRVDYTVNDIVPPGQGASSLARVLGVDARQIYRAKADGISRECAERWANIAHEHPYSLWPNMADDDIDDLKQVCEECGAKFLSDNPRRRFCCKSCRNRRQQRARYQTDPAYRAGKVAYSRAYYAECGEYVRERQRRQRSAAA